MLQRCHEIVNEIMTEILLIWRRHTTVGWFLVGMAAVIYCHCFRRHCPRTTKLVLQSFELAYYF